MISDQRFPFGQPVLPRAPHVTEPRPLYVLGAYPSALHIRWLPPPPLKKIQAIAVGNEPDFFWDGRDEENLIKEWCKAVQFAQSWGNVEPAGKLNGSSGSWLNDYILTPLNFTRAQAWISDCLDTYRCSKGLSERIIDTYSPFAKKAGLPAAKLLPHPSEAEIVSKALADHLVRLKNEIALANPEMIITLGNAALRVLPHVLAVQGNAPEKLSSSPKEYANRLKVETKSGKYADWIPLGHPAAPAEYQRAHERWIKNRSK